MLGVTGNDSGGRLTVDHFQPQTHGGADNAGNLLYCCYRCNLYKSDNSDSSSRCFGCGNQARRHLLAGS
jgi:HNH endonuclease